MGIFSLRFFEKQVSAVNFFFAIPMIYCRFFPPKCELKWVFFYFFKAAELDFSSASESGQLKSSKADNIMKNLRSSRDNKQLPGNKFLRIFFWF